MKNMLYILPPIHGITSQIEQIQNKYSGIILHYETGDIYEEAQRLSKIIEDQDNILLGFSIGGLIAIEIASIFPAKVQSAITIRTLTHPKYIPFRVNFYKRLLLFTPEIVFGYLYQKRHTTSVNLPSKEILALRLASVQQYMPKPFSRTYWIEPVGEPAFGKMISMNELSRILLN